MKKSKSCTACHLYKYATQTVFGEGLEKAKILMVGEQPGDQEDIQGKPFVGPAGKLLAKALAEAKIEKSEVYLTNTVKHFKFREVGKRRIHERPRGVEIKACRGWLEAELHLVKPKVVVCLGATASQSVIDKKFSVQKSHGKVGELLVPALLEWKPFKTKVVATLHPSALLRMTTHEEREEEFKTLVKDLKRARTLV